MLFRSKMIIIKQFLSILKEIQEVIITVYITILVTIQELIVNQIHLLKWWQAVDVVVVAAAVDIYYI